MTLTTIALGQQILAEDVLAYSAGEPKSLVIRFRDNGFEGAANLAMLMEQHPAQLHAPFTYGALVAAFIDNEWPVPNGYTPERSRTFLVVQYLHEKPKVLDLFLSEVLPFLECSALVDEANREKAMQAIARL